MVTLETNKQSIHILWNDCPIGKIFKSSYQRKMCIRIDVPVTLPVYYEICKEVEKKFPPDVG